MYFLVQAKSKIVDNGIILEMNSLLRPSSITNNKEICTNIYSITAAYTRECERACIQVAENGGIKRAVGIMNKYKDDQDLVVATLQTMVNVISSKNSYVHFFILAGGVTLLYEIARSTQWQEFLGLANIVRGIFMQEYKDTKNIDKIAVHSLEKEKNVAFCPRMRADGISPAEDYPIPWNWNMGQGQQDMLAAMTSSEVPNAETVYHICQSIVDKLRAERFVSTYQLTDDEVCALAFYTFDYAIYNSELNYTTPFQFINMALSNRTHENMYPICGLLRHLMSGFSKLPKYATHTLYMTCKRGDFKCQQGSEYKWNVLRSATPSWVAINTVKRAFDDDTILTISGISWGYDISRFSFFSPKYPEIVIEPERPVYFINSTRTTINFEVGEERRFPYAFPGVDPLHFSKEHTHTYIHIYIYTFLYNDFFSNNIFR